MSPRPFLAASLFLLMLGGCGLPAPYQTYPPSTPPAPPPRAPNALTVSGATTTTPENELDFTGQEMQPPAATLPTPAPAETAASAAQQVAICYNRLWNSAEAVHAAAVLACGAKSAPRVVSQDTDLNACPVMTPTHAVFACGAAP